MSFRPVLRVGEGRPFGVSRGVGAARCSACRGGRRGRLLGVSRTESLVSPCNRDGNLIVAWHSPVETGYALPIRYLGIGRDEHLPKSPSVPHAESS